MKRIALSLHRFILSSFFALSLAVYGQEVWNLQQCLDYSRTHNLSVQQAAANTRLTETDLTQSKNDFLPSLNGSGGYNLNFGRSVDFVTYDVVTQGIQSVNLGLSNAYSLYEGGRRKLALQQRQLQIDASKINEQTLIQGLELSIINAYLQILQAEAQQNVLKSQSRITQDRLSQSDKLIKAGSMPAGDILPLKSQEANDELAIIRARNSVSAAYLLLSQAMNYFEPFRVVIPDKTTEMDDLDILVFDAVFETASAIRPEILAADVERKLAEKNIAVARSTKWPVLQLAINAITRYSSLGKHISGEQNLTLPIGYVAGTNELVFSSISQPTYTKSSFFSQLNENFNLGGGLSLQIPIFNKHQVKNNVSRGQIAVEIAELRRQSARNDLHKTLKEAFLNANNALQAYNASKVAVEAATAAFDNTEKKFKAGFINQYEYNLAQNNLTTAFLNLESAKYNYLFMRAILDYLQGKPMQI